MKKTLKLALLALTLIAASFSLTGCSYNRLVDERETVESQWANVENRYQERYDLVPNLVNTVKGIAAHEEQVFADVADARAKLGSTTINLDSSITDNPDAFAAYQQSQAALSSSLSRLMAVSEAYPELKSSANFQDLQSQLEGIENRIATERKRYNDAVKAYNTSIQRFPTLITAKMFNFTSKAYFSAEEAAYKAPKVEF